MDGWIVRRGLERKGRGYVWGWSVGVS